MPEEPGSAETISKDTALALTCRQFRVVPQYSGGKRYSTRPPAEGKVDQIKKKSIREVKGEYRFAEWAGLVRECRHSGLNIMTWCEQKGITTNQFYNWQRKVFDALMEQRESQIQGTGLQEPIDGLAALVQRQFELEPFTNTLFLFCGRRRDRLKALYWEKDGFLLLYKRLEVGTELCFFR